MRKENRLNYITAIILALLVCFAVIASSGIGGKAYAASSEYTDVLDDLNKDTSFNTRLYPESVADYSIRMIQIAESNDGELFIYVYQPSGQTKNLTATTVRLSTSNNDNAQWSDYKLTQLSSNGVFYKYKVDELTLKTDPIRYYNIVAIHRRWDSSIDKGSGNDNIINEVVYEVGQLWTVVTQNDEVSYNMTTTETVEITDKYVGTVRYSNGMSWFANGACDGHFVAFSTNRQIDKLLEADVSYVSKTYNKTLTGTTYGNPEKQTVLLEYDEYAGNTVNGIFAKSYKWKRIQSASEFVSDKNVDDSIKNALSSKQWVLNFAETEYTQDVGVVPGLVGGLIGIAGVLIGSQFSSGTLVSEVSILRLKFETEGKVYNLGVVDNKQTGTSIINVSEVIGFFKYLWNCIIKLITRKASSWETFVAIATIIVTIIVALIVLAIAVPFLRWVKKRLSSKGKDKEK